MGYALRFRIDSQDVPAIFQAAHRGADIPIRHNRLCIAPGDAIVIAFDGPRACAIVVAPLCPFGQREKRDDDSAIVELGDVRVTVIEWAIVDNLRAAPRPSIVFGADAAKSSTDALTRSWKCHMPGSSIENAQNVAIFQAARIRECLIRDGGGSAGYGLVGCLHG